MASGAASHPAVKECQTLTVNIACNQHLLPATVPRATEDDDIYRVFTTIEEETQWETFNRRFDIIFGNHLRNESGDLKNVKRGPFGMGLVSRYLKDFKFAELEPPELAEAALVKLGRLNDELVKLT
jgi:hypothetical protein